VFNKRETSGGDADTHGADSAASRSGSERSTAGSPAVRGSGAMIGPSIHIDGSLQGDEDLTIQGKVKGKVELKNNSVTIGESGHVTADIYAQTISVEGRHEGKLIASERVVIRKTARIKGVVIAPRVMLEDGAQFNGSIDMDPETEALKSAFSKASAGAAPKAVAAVSGKGDKGEDNSANTKVARSLL